MVVRKTETNTTIADTLDIAGNIAKYDAACKKLLSEKEILARILKVCVKEFQDCAIKDIVEKYIEGDPIVGEIPVERDVAPNIQGLSTEDKTLQEGTVYYDIRFSAYAPTTGDSIKLIINIEAQNQSSPGYSLTKRAIYYCGRLLSSQHGKEFDHSDYDKVKKVYSIWICPEPQADRKNTITAYQITEKNLVGEFREKVINYDMLCAVMVCLGDLENTDRYSLLRMLQVLFSDKIEVREKKEILEEDFSIPMSEEIEKEVNGMCNLSQSIWDRGVDKGVAIGIEKGVTIGMEKGVTIGMEKGTAETNRRLVLAMLQNREPLEKIKMYTGFSDAEITALSKIQPAQ